MHYTASQHYQENVFIEGSRPQYLEDLHTEAQEGLKILQQEGQTSHPAPECSVTDGLLLTCDLFLFSFTEHKNGLNFPDDDSVVVSHHLVLV